MTDYMFPQIMRVQMLMESERLAEAEKELRKMLCAEPDHSLAHGMLAVCLSHRLKHEEALREAKTAIAIDPDEAGLHYFGAECLMRAKQLDDAKQCIERAISLDPDDADYFYMKAAIELEKNERKTARASLMKALEIDPEHENSLTLLARVQAILGDTQSAEYLAGEAVRNRPESAEAHVSRGYSLLFSGNAKESFEAFREALRLDPNNEAARVGLLEAIKIHNIFYRYIFWMFAAMTRLSAQYQWFLIVGILVGYNVLRGQMERMPELTPVIMPLLVLCMGFVLITWLTDPIIYTTLWFSRWGRLAMTVREKLIGAVTILLGAGGLACYVTSVMTESETFTKVAMGCLFLLLPVTRGLKSGHPDDMKLSAVISTLIVLFILQAIITQRGYGLAVLTFIAYIFITNYMVIKRSAPRD